MKTKFLNEFTIIRMAQNSMVLENNKGQQVYIMRNLFNKIMTNDSKIVDYTIVEGDRGILWIELLSWSRF
jgi:uncharacterized ubiquitin-like protein YukD